jgi:hypothetical protein
MMGRLSSGQERLLYSFDVVSKFPGGDRSLGRLLVVWWYQPR